MKFTKNASQTGSHYITLIFSFLPEYFRLFSNYLMLRSSKCHIQFLKKIHWFIFSLPHQEIDVLAVFKGKIHGNDIRIKGCYSKKTIQI